MLAEAHSHEAPAPLAFRGPRRDEHVYTAPNGPPGQALASPSDRRVRGYREDGPSCHGPKIRTRE